MEYWSFGVSGNVGITGLAWSAVQGMHSIEEELAFVHVEFTVYRLGQVPWPWKNEHSDAPRGQKSMSLPKSIPSTPIHPVQCPI